MATGYREVKAALLTRLRAGEWPAGSTMPGEVQLADEYGCARVTVNRALRELAEDGIVKRWRRRGTEVVAGRGRHTRLTIRQARQQVETDGKTYRYECLRQRLRTPPVRVADQLGLNREAEVMEVLCRHWADDRPYQLEERWINLTAVPEAREVSFAELPPGEWLLDVKPLSDAEHVLTAANATSRNASRLSLDIGDALFVIERRTWWQGQAVTSVRLMHPANGFRLVTRDVA
ncbi:UTRA domain-containing protein [uncultured Abyssibacter sp.]|uniref:UTRA domain-containing protein n=1 Tax=uncultured Abyssibacter sp. TaxID=2320202 RepID=UPI0032B17429